MKLTAIFLTLLLFSANQYLVKYAAASGSFTFKIETEENNRSFAFQVYECENFEVDWGEGSGYEEPADGTKLFSYEYKSPGEYKIKVRGKTERISFYGEGKGTPGLLTDILTPVTDGVEGITSAKEMFRSISSFDGYIGNWDVSNLKNFATFLKPSKLPTETYNKLREVHLYKAGRN